MILVSLLLHGEGRPPKGGAQWRTKGTRTSIAIFTLRASLPVLGDSEPEDVGLVVIGDGTDELVALIEEIVELPEGLFAPADGVVVLDDGMVVLLDDDRVAGLTGYEDRLYIDLVRVGWSTGEY